MKCFHILIDLDSYCCGCSLALHLSQLYSYSTTLVLNWGVFKYFSSFQTVDTIFALVYYFYYSKYQLNQKISSSYILKISYRDLYGDFHDDFRNKKKVLHRIYMLSGSFLHNNLGREQSLGFDV